ncbi:MAG: hypothetical protein J0L93_02940 [Deltaproteobacteria bacterium]|nr:hypothetical protein [Deltaproteobacteria bacterium]
MTPQQLDELGSQISHDLKDALKSISLNLDFILRGLKEKNLDFSKDRAEEARATSQKLIRFIDGLIGLSVAGRAKADEVFKMNDVVFESIEELSDLISVYRPQIDVGDLGEVKADSYLLKEVWRQLIDNAIRYGFPREAQPKISIGRSQNIFYIKDAGQGVPDSEMSKLFSSITKSSENKMSMGLGLLFCRRVIERLGGKIWYEKRDGETCFLFSLA